MTKQERIDALNIIEVFCTNHRCSRCPLDNLEECMFDETTTDSEIQEAVKMIDDFNNTTKTRREQMIDNIDYFCNHYGDCDSCPLHELDCTDEEEDKLIILTNIIQESQKGK